MHSGAGGEVELHADELVGWGNDWKHIATDPALANCCNHEWAGSLPKSEEPRYAGPGHSLELGRDDGKAERRGSGICASHLWEAEEALRLRLSHRLQCRSSQGLMGEDHFQGYSRDGW